MRDFLHIYLFTQSGWAEFVENKGEIIYVLSDREGVEARTGIQNRRITILKRKAPFPSNCVDGIALFPSLLLL